VTIRLRTAGREDAPAIAETLAICFDTYRGWTPGWSPPDPPEGPFALDERLANPGVWSLIAFDGDEVAGHVALAADTPPTPQMAAPPGHAKLWMIFVRPPWQGTGLAPRLMEAVEREAIERGFARMALWTPRDNARARRFYERAGWRPSGREYDENPMGLPVVEYVRTLRPER
jgi:GNAT superfamily N-acetyltransferase